MIKSTNDLNNILNISKQIMDNVDSKKSVSSSKSMIKENVAPSVPKEEYSNDFSMPDMNPSQNYSQIEDDGPSFSMTDIDSTIRNKYGIGKSSNGIDTSRKPNKNVPNTIYEQIVNNPIDMEDQDIISSLFSDVSVSNTNEAQEPKQSHAQKPSQLVSRPNPQPIIENAPAVDYSMIKMIVEGTMKKYINALAKKLITEEKERAPYTDEINIIQLGKKFQILTKDGNLYSANLKFIKNINQK